MLFCVFPPMKMIRMILLAAVLGSCTKSDTTAPAIQLESPSDNENFPGGQMVRIRAHITDNESIHMVHVTVMDETTNGHLLHLEEHTDGRSYQLNQQFMAEAGSIYSIEISAEDHDQNASTKKIRVTGL